VWLASVTVSATQTSVAQFSITQLGTLLTNNGRVVIRDNGVLFNGLGGYAVLVDGSNGYFYRIAGAGTVTFTGNTTINTPTISFSGGALVPNYLLVSSGTITDSLGAVPANTTISSISFTSNTITLSANATSNQTGDTFTLNIPQFGRILDPAFLGASRVAFIEGWLIFNQPGTRTFYTNAPVPYTLTFAGSFYALKDSSTDNLVTLFENNRELWLVGEKTTEVWYNAGGTNFAFSRLPGIGPQMGCSAQHSITRVGKNLAWLGRNEQGENIVVMTNQYAVDRVSTHAIDNALAMFCGLAGSDCGERRREAPENKTTLNVSVGLRLPTRFSRTRFAVSSGNPYIDPETSSTKMYSRGGMSSAPIRSGGWTVRRKNFSSGFSKTISPL